MFIRQKKSKSSKRPTLQLVENNRVGHKIKQRIIVSLGVGFSIDSDKRRLVAAAVEQKLLRQLDLYIDPEVDAVADRIVKKIQTEGRWTSSPKTTTDPDKAESPNAQQTAEVVIDQVEHSNDRELGPLFIGHCFWQRLSFDEILRKCDFNERQIKTAELSVLNRLIAQNSEHAIPGWLKTVAAEDLIDKSAEDFAEDRFYLISDKLFKYKNTIEEQLYIKERNLFNLNNFIYLYDLTNTYFEGLCRRNPKAKFNKNQKEKRSDCRQIVIALVLDQEGFIRRHYVLDGKTSDAKSLEDILEALEKDFQNAELPTIIMDRGVISAANEELLQSKGLNYIVATRSGEEKPLINDFLNADFKVLKDHHNNKVEVFLKQENDLTYLLCKSSARKVKEQAMRNQAEERLDQNLNKLKKLIDTGKRKDPSVVQQAIGRIKERHSKVSHYYSIEFTPFSFEYKIPANTDLPKRLLNSLEKLYDKATHFEMSHVKLKSELDKLSQKYPDDYEKIKVAVTDPEFFGKPLDEKREKSQNLDGNYLLKTTRNDLTDNEIWRMYVMLTRVEAAFRNLKTDLKLRPNFHQKNIRVEGHVFITILAYHLLHSIEHKLRENDCTFSWATVKRVISSHNYSTIILPTVHGTVIHLRKPGIPEPAHQKIYDKLQIRPLALPTLKTEIFKKLG
ncbi:MAG: IS1634 family transposase [Methanosarcinaceae archaeon]